MSALVASIAVSIFSSRAICDTHAEISVMAGRSDRSRSSVDLGASGGVACFPAATAARISSAIATLGVSIVDAPRLLQVLRRRRRTLRDPEDRQVGEDLAHGDVDAHRTVFAPCGDGLGDGTPVRSQRTGVLEAQPGVRGQRSADRTCPQLLAGLLGPLQTSGRLELGDERVVHAEQVLDVGCGVLALAVA